MERERIGGKKVWRCIRDMQRRRRGLLPSRVVTIHDVDRFTCVSTRAQHQRWRQHFTKVLNIMSEFDQSELDLVRQCEVVDILASMPSATEVKNALSKLKNGKATPLDILRFSRLYLHQIVHLRTSEDIFAVHYRWQTLLDC